MEAMVPFEDFAKIDLRVAKVITAERVAGSEKLLKLEVDVGGKTQQIVAGIGKAYAPEDLAGREIVIAANLEPRTLMGIPSHGMLLAASDGAPTLLMPDREVPPGSKVT